jgi:hypothetical protein
LILQTISCEFAEEHKFKISDLLLVAVSTRLRPKANTKLSLPVLFILHPWLRIIKAENCQGSQTFLFQHLKIFYIKVIGA